MASANRQKSRLTATSLQRARPREKPCKLSDRDGLYLLIEPSGSRVRRMNSRFQGVQRTITFGHWPVLTLPEAREHLLEARRLLAKGIDPVEKSKLDKIAKSLAAKNDFQSIANEWLEKIEREGAAPMPADNIGMSASAKDVSIFYPVRGGGVWRYSIRRLRLTIADAHAADAAQTAITPSALYLAARSVGLGVGFL